MVEFAVKMSICTFSNLCITVVSVIIRIIQHIKNLAGYRPQDQFSGIVDQSATEFWRYTCRKFLFDIVDVPAL